MSAATVTARERVAIDWQAIRQPSAYGYDYPLPCGECSEKAQECRYCRAILCDAHGANGDLHAWDCSPFVAAIEPIDLIEARIACTHNDQLQAQAAAATANANYSRIGVTRARLEIARDMVVGKRPSHGVTR